MLWSHKDGGKEHIRAVIATGARDDDYYGPIDVLTSTNAARMNGAAVSDDRQLALALHTTSPTNEWVQLVSFTKDLLVKESRAIPAPPGEMQYGCDLRWSPGGVLYSWHSPKRGKTQLVAFLDGKWSVVAEQEQPERAGYPGFHRIYFRRDDSPILVWDSMHH